MNISPSIIRRFCDKIVRRIARVGVGIFALYIGLLLNGPVLSAVSLILPRVISDAVSSIAPAKAHAESSFNPSSIAVTQGTQLTDINFAALSNGSTPTASSGQHWRILTTASGLDATVTFENVALNGANMIYVNYDGSVSNASLTYQVQIRDFAASTWRNLVPHESNLSNTTESASGLITQTTAAVNNGYQFTVYDGYFTNGSGTPIQTDMADFINGSDQMQIRFYSAVSTPNYELRVDYLSIEPTIEMMRYTSGISFGTNGGSVTAGEYNDTTTDDASGTTITAGSAGIDAQFAFSNLATPYTGANTILVEFSGNKDASLTNYQIYIRDYTNSQWDLLSSTALTNTSDALHAFATDASQFANYISSNAATVQVYSTDSSGTATVDYLRITVGSTTTNTGFYVGTVSRGGSPTGTAANTATVDTTSGAPSTWSIPTSTSDTRTTTEFNGDCGTATNSCAAANIQIPVTVSNNQTVTGIHMAVRYAISVATVDLEFGIRDKRVGNVALTTAVVDETAQHVMYRTAAYPMQPQIGNDPIATIPIYQPQQYTNTVDDAINVYMRTAATSVATAQTFTWDFAFVSIRTIDVGESITSGWTPTGATLTQGTNSASNYRFGITDDNGYWTVTQNGTNGTDVYMSFTNITVPSGANKIIVTTNMRWSAASTNFELYLYDFVGATWREITPHATNFTSSGTGNTEQIVQLEVYDGYISNASNTPVSTPIANFVSGSEARLRILSASTTSAVGVDYALLEFVKDPVYFPAAMSATGTITGGTEYNDLTLDDNTSNLVITYSGGLQADFTFSNVLTPPAGANAAYLAFSGFRTTITNYTLSLRNYGGGSCVAGYEAFNATALTNTGDATNYFIKSIADWSCYISSNQMEVRLTTTGASGSVTLDFMKLALGSVNADANAASIDVGGTYIGDAVRTRTMDTSATFNGTAHAWRIRSAPTTLSNRQYDAPSVLAARIAVPLTMPTGASPVSLVYMWAGSGATTMTLTPSFKEARNYYADAATTKSTMTSQTALPTAIDTVTQAVASLTIREGWYGLNVTSTTPVTSMANAYNTLDTIGNTVPFRFRTSASTNFATAIFDLDALFVALRYVD